MTETDARSLAPATQEALRRKAVEAIRQGMSQSEAARVFGVSRQAIWNWLQRFGRGGARALKARQRGRPRGAKRLKPWQAATVVRLIGERPPDQLRLPFYLWTRQAVIDLVERRFGVGLSLSTVGRYLRHWGFTPQKPIRRAFEQNPEQVRQWLQKEYPRIRATAKRQGARIYWGDEMGVRSDHSAGRSYARRGHTPQTPGTGQRFGCNTISALTNQGHLGFMVFRGRFKAPVFITFLRRLVRQAGRKCFLIVDRHPVHRARQVKRWVGKHREQLKLFFLPPYSPELNPDEFLNQDVKTNAVGRCRPRTQDEMLSHVRGYFRGTQRCPQIISNYFQHPTVLYAAF